MPTGDKAPDAFRTIGELSAELGVPQHILRYWETKFPQLRPLQRAGNRRYYRPADVALTRRLHHLLNEEGYTVRGVQKLLAESGAPAAPGLEPVQQPAAPTALSITERRASSSFDLERLGHLRDRLNEALSR